MNSVLAALIVVTSVLACSLATRTRDEMQYLEKPLRVLQALSGLALLFVLPWWLALVLAGALAIGGYPMAVAVSALAAVATGSITAVALPLAMLAGARWEVDTRDALQYAGLLLVATLIFAGLNTLGLF